jgi:outer membrane protein assembly factor BamB
MHHWARGACLYGIMPANGMVYAPQHPCACYLMSKISGFCALAPGGKSPEPPLAEEDRLQRGPAYDALAPRPSPLVPADDWPMYRRDAERSGFSPQPVATDLADCWRQKLPGPVTAPILAEDKLFAAVPSQHAVYALSASAGQLLWQFTAGGPVDSAPAYARGRIVFGSSDGCVYCLDAATGGLLWRYRAAPTQRRHMYFEQIESTHPVSGSVLVQDDKVYAVSGRYRFLDGGLRFLILDLATGNKLAETVLDATDSQTGKPFQLNHDLLSMPTATPDILVSDGRAIYMKDQEFALDGRPGKTVVPNGFDNGDEVRQVLESESTQGPRHLLCPTGLLDDSFWHRSYWVYGTTFFSGYNGYFVAGRQAPAGRILVFNRDTVFGYGRRASMYKWSSPMEYTLFAARKDAPMVTGSGSGPGGMQKFERVWEREDPLQVRALTLAGPRLLVLGVKDVLDETKARNDPAGGALQEEYMTGRHGSILWVVDAATGQTLAERPLDQFPTFDGMACAYGRVFVTGADGTVQCLGERAR